MLSDNKKDKVSVIVPVYNDEKYIRFCMESIAHQTYSKLEIILVDDASQDASLEICKEYAQSDNRIVVLHNEENLGLSGSREKGYRSATGEWICFVDHDDCMDTRAIEKMIAVADESTDIITGKYKNVLTQYFERYGWDNNDNETKIITLRHDEALNALGDFDKMDVPTCLWNKLYRRELFERIEIEKYKEKFFLIYFEDTMLTPMLIKACRKLKIVDRYLYIHRIDYHSVSMSPNALEFNLQTARAADIVMSQLDEPYAKQAYIAYMQGYLLVFSKNWYLVWRYYNKDTALLNEMAALFDKYYVMYRKLHERMVSVPDFCIRIFKLNKILFSAVVCTFWFGYAAKMKYRLGLK